MSAKHYHLYRDQHTGGWVLEILALGEWYVLGVYGSRQAAMAAFNEAGK